jgi:hypothetical protein
MAAEFEFSIFESSAGLTPEGPAVWPHKQPDFPLKRHAGKSDVAQ